MKGEIKSAVPSVDAAIRILQFLSKFENKNSTLSEIAHNTNINKSTCLRILRVLNENRLVAYDEDTKKYSLGVYLAVLGAKASEYSDQLKISKPYLRRLMEVTGLTSVLVQPITDKLLIYIDKEEPSSNLDVKINVVLGKGFPITSTAYGKCFLAYKSEEEVNQLIKEVGLVKYTDNSITDLAEYKQNLAQVRAKGYAVSNEERVSGIVSVAAPVFDVSGKVSMVLACLGVSAHMDEKKVAECGSLVMKMAGEITVALGGRIVT